VLRSLLALALAVCAIPVVNLMCAWLSDHVFGLRPGGTLRLAVDLFWVFLAGAAGAWLMAHTAAVSKTAHVWVWFVLYLAAAVFSAAETWSDFPRWFTLGIVLLSPLQAWLGWWLAWGRQRRHKDN
jgi:hypothetical protein